MKWSGKDLHNTSMLGGFAHARSVSLKRLQGIPKGVYKLRKFIKREDTRGGGDRGWEGMAGREGRRKAAKQVPGVSRWE